VQYKLFRDLRKPRPFADVLTLERLKEVPETFGVYIFQGPNADEILYVGKAKNLRARLKSYRHLSAERAPRKLLRLARRIRDFRYEILSSEESALLRENELLRNIKPHFNRMNVNVDYYSYLSVEISTGKFDGEVSVGLPVNTADREVYGPFKSSKRLRSFIKSLQNLRKETLIKNEEIFWILTGRSDGSFLDRAAVNLEQKKESLCPLWAAQLAYDAEFVKSFWESTLRRNRQLIDRFGIDRNYLLPDELDDLVVQARDYGPSP
jgi:hypothetical protein